MIQQCGCGALFAIALTAFGGCNSGSTNAPKATSSRAAQDVHASIAPTSSTDEALAVSILEKAKAVLKRDASNRISEVDLRGLTVDDTLATNIAKLSALQAVTMDQAELTSEGWSQLGGLKSLRVLDLRECKLTNEHLATVLSNLSQLRALKLSGKNGATVVDDAAMEAVAKCKDLKVLALDFLWISEVGLAKLVGVSGLSELYLANSLVDDAGAEELATLSQLMKLRLARTQITNAGLAKLSSLKLLEELDLSECSQLDDEGLQSVGRLFSLKRLNLWRDQISDTGVAQLAKLTNLEWLNLDNTQLSDAGLVHLAGLRKLTFLHLGSTSVSDAGMDHLKSLVNLKDLKVTRTAVTEAGVSQLRTILPGTAIQLKYSETE